MPQTYNTKQRELILGFLTEKAQKHVSVDEIIEYLSSQQASVSKSTIYRQLDKLVSEGIIRRFFLEEGMGACYQYAGGEGCRTHYHFKCTGCGELLHVECEELDRLEEHVLSDHGFQLEAAKTVLYGVCEKCRKNSH